MKTPSRSKVVKSLIGMALFIAILTAPIYFLSKWVSNTVTQTACPEILDDPDFAGLTEQPVGSTPLTEAEREQMEKLVAAMQTRCADYEMEKTR